MLVGLKNGNVGAYVDLLQLALSRANAPELVVDGVFGMQTQAALKNFQIVNSLEDTGRVDEATQRSLLPFLLGYKEVVLNEYDTFYNLARRYKTTVSAIRRANPGVEPNNLITGQNLIVPLGFELVAVNIRYTYYYLELLIEGLKVRFPFCGYSRIGKTVQGKDLFCIDIGTGNKKLMYNASHHANEWITSPLVLKYFEDYANAVYENRTITDFSARMLYEKTRLYIVPMVDADGVDLVNGVSDGMFYDNAVEIAQHFPSIPFPSGWKANISGVDLNLNYPAQWERAKRIKYALGFDRPAPRDFVGRMPISTPESEAMIRFTRENEFLLTISYHTQGNVIYWKFDDYEPPRALEIGRAFSEASGYPLELTPTVSGAAGYKDWFIQEYNRPGYTIEVGQGQSPIPVAQFDEIYKNNIGIMSLGIQMV